jgi:triosephosphate isomerase (TIM)
VIAYEPVRAIAPERVASATDAQEVATRSAMRYVIVIAGGGAVRLLYGGSVNAKNVCEIVA